jgi:hypothetical protein
MPAVSSWDLASDEHLDFGHGFFVSAKVPPKVYNSATMITIASLNLEDEEFTMKVSNVTTDSAA